MFDRERYTRLQLERAGACATRACDHARVLLRRSSDNSHSFARADFRAETQRRQRSLKQEEELPLLNQAAAAGKL